MKEVRYTMSGGCVAGGSAGLKTQRGPDGQKYILSIFLFLTGFLYFILNMIPNHYWYYKIILFIILTPILAYLCFRNAKAQELIFKIKIKLEDHIKIQ